MSDDGPFTDDMIRGYLQTAKMQQEIIPHMEEMAQKLAAAGVASNKVKGDSPEFAIDRWCDVIRNRAKELLREKLRDQPAKSKPMIEKMKRLK
jgi:hypothetical protein